MSLFSNAFPFAFRLTVSAFNVTCCRCPFAKNFAPMWSFLGSELVVCTGEVKSLIANS